MRQGVGKHRNYTFAAQSENGNDLVVVAGINVKFILAERGDLRNLRDVAGGFFDANDIGVIGKRGNRCRQEVAAGAAGHVVKNAGLCGGVGNGAEGSNQAVLRCLIVVGRYQKHGVGANLAGVFGQVDGISRIVGAGSGNHRDATCHAVHAKLQNRTVFLVGQGRAFAGGSRGNNGVDAAVDLPINQAPECLIIYTVCGQRGNNGGCNAFKNSFFHLFILFLKKFRTL